MSDLNDPRVFFAAERTLLAWNRTSLTLMAFGFVIEHFGLFVYMLFSEKIEPLQKNFSFWIGLHSFLWVRLPRPPQLLSTAPCCAALSPLRSRRAIESI